MVNFNTDSFDWEYVLLLHNCHYYSRLKGGANFSSTNTVLYPLPEQGRWGQAQTKVYSLTPKLSEVYYNIYTFQRDTQCSSTDLLLMHRCQMYMFRTVTVHPQELLFRCCMCRIRYLLIRPAGATFEEVLPQTLHQRDVPDSAFLTTYHNLHIQHLKRSS